MGSLWKDVDLMEGRNRLEWCRSLLVHRSSWSQLWRQPQLWQPVLHNLPFSAWATWLCLTLGPYSLTLKSPSSLCLLDPSPTFLPILLVRFLLLLLKIEYVYLHRAWFPREQGILSLIILHSGFMNLSIWASRCLLTTQPCLLGLEISQLALGGHGLPPQVSGPSILGHLHVTIAGGWLPWQALGPGVQSQSFGHCHFDGLLPLLQLAGSCLKGGGNAVSLGAGCAQPAVASQLFLLPLGGHLLHIKCTKEVSLLMSLSSLLCFLCFFSRGMGTFLSSWGSVSFWRSLQLMLCLSMPLGLSSCWVTLGLPSSSSWELLRLADMLSTSWPLKSPLSLTSKASSSDPFFFFQTPLLGGPFFLTLGP